MNAKKKHDFQSNTDLEFLLFGLDPNATLDDNEDGTKSVVKLFDSDLECTSPKLLPWTLGAVSTGSWECIFDATLVVVGGVTRLLSRRLFSPANRPPPVFRFSAFDS